MNKHARHEAIRSRCRLAIFNLYHNATPALPSEADEAFFSWLAAEAAIEIDYINDGGVYGHAYGKVVYDEARFRRLRAGAGSVAAHRYALAAMRRATRARNEDRGKDNAWEWITDYGQVFQFGRGGRTLAPRELIIGGITWRVQDEYFNTYPISDVVDAIRIIESFNRYVGNWCRAVPSLWAEIQKDVA